MGPDLQDQGNEETKPLLGQVLLVFKGSRLNVKQVRGIVCLGLISLPVLANMPIKQTKVSLNFDLGPLPLDTHCLACACVATDRFPRSAWHGSIVCPNFASGSISDPEVKIYF